VIFFSLIQMYMDDVNLIVEIGDALVHNKQISPNEAVSNRD